MKSSSNTLALLLLGAMLTFSLWTANAAPSSPGDAKATSPPQQSVEVRLAEAHLKLAKLDVQRVAEANQRMPGLYSAEYVERLHLHVAIDEEALKQNLKGEAADAHAVCIRAAEASLKIAEAELTRARAVHKRLPSRANALYAERAEAAAAIARLHHERAATLEESTSLLTHLQWQLDDLRHQVLELQKRQMQQQPF